MGKGQTCLQHIQRIIYRMRLMKFCMWFSKWFYVKNVLLISITQQFPNKGFIDDDSALVQVMAWCRIGTMPSFEPMMTKFYGILLHRQESVIYSSILRILSEIMAFTDIDILTHLCVICLLFFTTLNGMMGKTDFQLHLFTMVLTFKLWNQWKLGYSVVASHRWNHWWIHIFPSGSFEIHWGGQYLINFRDLAGIVNATVYKTEPIFTGLGHGKLF